jgi:hypothetical protein
LRIKSKLKEGIPIGMDLTIITKIYRILAVSTMEVMSRLIVSKIPEIKKRMSIPDPMKHRLEKIILVREITTETIDNHMKTIIAIKKEVTKDINLMKQIMMKNCIVL